MKLFLPFSILLLAGIVINAQTPAVQWAKGFGSAGLGTGQSISTDSAGNVYVAGNFSDSTLIIGKDTLLNSATNGATNMFIAKFDSSGNALWAKSAGGGVGEGPEAVSVVGLGTDPGGNAYVVGSFETPILIFGNDTLITSKINSFLVKYNSQGAAVWAINMGGGLNDADGIVVDASGNSYITGSFTGSSIIGGRDTVPLSGYIGGYVIKYDSSGNGVWAAGITGGNVFNYAIALDGGGYVYVTGTYNDSAVVSHNITLINTGATGMFTVKYDKTGHAVWAQNMSVSGNIYPTGISTDGQSNIYLSGNTNSDTLVFGGDTAFTFTSSATGNIFVAKYDSSGNAQWARCTQNNNAVVSSGIGADAGGHVYITGTFNNGSLQIGNITLTNHDTLVQAEALFLAEYDALGNVVWVTGGLAPEDDMDGGVSVEVDNQGHLYVSGSYAGPSVIFGNDTLPFSGSVGVQSNVFVAKYGVPETNTAISQPSGGANSLIVYPNPSTGAFCFKGLGAGSTLEIYDVLGRLICSTVTTSNNYWLNISTQTKGVYFFRTVDETGTAQQGKIVME